MSQITCVTVVQWSTSCLNVQINRVLLPATRFSVSLYRFVFSPVWSLFFNTIFPFGLFFFILNADPAGHALGSIIYFEVRSFILKKVFQKLLICIPARKKKNKKNISCQDMSILWNSWFFFSVLVDIMTNNTQYTTNCVSFAQHPPVTNWRNLNLPFEHRLNHQYHYAKISTGFAPKN